MNMEFLQPKRDQYHIGDKQTKVMKSLALRSMDNQELSLGPSLSTYVTSSGNSSSSEQSDGSGCRKRKHSWDDQLFAQASVDLQLNDPLPLDWEQCLDLQSGRMYYLNRKTLRKSWSRPRDHEQKLDLELNIATPFSPPKQKTTTTLLQDDLMKHTSKSCANNMVAVACFNCHLLVMLCRSSPSCPNCKYIHPLATKPQMEQPHKMEATKPLETLSLLN